MKKKILQVPVIVGKGSEQFFVEKDLCIAPSNPPIYKIEKIDKKVVIIDANVIPGKVIFNAYIWKTLLTKPWRMFVTGLSTDKYSRNLQNPL